MWEAIQQHREHQESTGELEAKRGRRVLEEVKNMVAFRLREQVASKMADQLAADLATRRLDPYRAAEILLERVGAPSNALVGEGDG